MNERNWAFIETEQYISVPNTFIMQTMINCVNITFLSTPLNIHSLLTKLKHQCPLN